ncbi:serine/threonine-protein kinase [Streptomyces sp. NBC_01264]|uniref:serine/threonine-protein kinase n=1 Tax=Streptomyces sp. NBC_01264 TaxID=2903804 RepID=UPI00224C8952|nr:serine/threonine-protein kinase [Streptomyces sp. NBC_01264]MCX4782829.1 serine/threonine protein kinase [Streptomyces sp. NBC_01264]
MGTVWRATDELLGRPVAVKELHAGEGDGDGVAAGALREARAVAHVRHPHVVVVHDVVEHRGRPCIVMELVDGGSLADLISAGKTLTPVETARTALALLGALTAAHGRGVLHRDVKPANVLMEAGTGRVVLTDFGIARFSGATTISQTGAFVGSPEYTAPERMRGGEAGPAADLWSLGTLMCTALTGESPFRRDSLGGVLHAVVTAEIRPPAQAGPLLPVIRGLLERDPERRMPAAEADRLLSAYLAGGSPAAEPMTVPADRRPVAVPVPVAGPSDSPSGDAPAAGPAPTPESEGLTAPAVAPRPTARQRVAIRTGLRIGLIAAAAVLVAAGVVVGADPLNLLSGANEGRQGSRSAPAAPGGAASPSPTPSGPPSGYRTFADPQGFAIAVPAGYQRATDDQRVFYVSPDGAFRIGIRVKMPVAGGPLGVMRQAHANGPDTNAGYRGGSVAPTTRHGLPAALWEFSWNGFDAAEGARHTYDLCWDQNGRMYDIWVSAPVGELAESKRHFDTAVATFVPGAPGSVTP